MEDHPRSRGVYAIAALVAGLVWGSSPLARGLHGVAVGHGAESRIIPARAGFTGAPLMLLTGRPDHPRSRGVYGDKIMTMLRTQGSSPLARGLQSMASVTNCT